MWAADSVSLDILYYCCLGAGNAEEAILHRSYQLVLVQEEELDELREKMEAIRDH